MIKEEHTLTVDEHSTLKVRFWLPEKPMAAIQLVHGMMEHSERYQGFAEWMCSQNIAVFANDHRGHGYSSENFGDTGYFAAKEGWNKVLKDLDKVRDLFSNKFPEIPVFMLGHSMGSLLARSYLLESGNKLQGLILSGTLEQAPLMIKLGKILAESMILLKGDKQRSSLMAYLSYGKFSGTFKPKRTAFDWISSLEEEVDRYIQDPLCGQPPPNIFYRDLFYGMSYIQNDKKLKLINKSLPILLFSGSEDPVGEKGKAPQKIAAKYSNAGFDNVKLKLYKGGRHEMLNEKDRETVYQDIIKWIKHNL